MTCIPKYTELSEERMEQENPIENAYHSLALYTMNISCQ